MKFTLSWVLGLVFVLNSSFAAVVRYAEVGPLPLDKEVDLDAPRAYRIESFGDLALEVDVAFTTGKKLPPNLVALSIEGPFVAPHYGDDVAPGSGPRIVVALSKPKSNAVRASARLEAAGVYRVLPATAEDASFRAKCLANCSRKALDPDQILERLKTSERLSKFRQELRAAAENMIRDTDLREQFIDHVHNAIEKKTLHVRERFPTVPVLSTFSPKLRPSFPGVEGKRKPNVRVFEGEDLFMLLGDCDADRTKLPDLVAPKEKDKTLENLRYGHYLDQSLTNCEIAHSKRLADMLTSLAANNGSRISYKAKTAEKKIIETPEALLSALVGDGYQIELRNERVYADFVALAIDGYNSRWPLWVDTGVPMKSGETFKTPMGHSQLSWYITGPNLQARVAFFLGMYGTGFFPLIEKRPAWTGMRALYSYSSKNEKQRKIILKSAELGSSYYKYARDVVSKLKLPSSGYGYIGVCNDSVAVIEQITQGTISTYPLVRALEMDPDDEPADLKAGFAGLPHDADTALHLLRTDRNTQKDVLNRMTLMIPFEHLRDLDQVDKDLRAEMREAIQFTKN